ncbi:hypothetical protein OG689_44245 [Kitasatospora sp. NBC_00240]|uniref:hypothetical protein n=1 Tax=Kitasatospora sp. NBC_00240 TaxID=2903567 RepID=UPI0022524C84|nr:hypothetical protein [Kitasatospora sp. NBC_00240]MCX5216149.1 hypothetical protein [Kitasatospora sp. NBC_00240]
MLSTPAQPPAWRRKRDSKRSEDSARRVAAHQVRLRSAAAAGGAKAAAEAEWDIVRRVIAGLPEGARDGEWAQLAAVLRQLSTRLTGGHNR